MNDPNSLTSVSPTKYRSLYYVGVGCVLYISFFALGGIQSGMWINFGGHFTRSSQGELHFWLAHAFLLVPACWLLGLGMQGVLVPWLQKIWHRAGSMTRQERTAGALFLFCIAFCLFRLGRSLVLMDFPITDDENSVRFGGQLMAQGQLQMPKPS